MTSVRRYNPDTSSWERILGARNGSGIPVGGSIDQVLTKKSSNEYDVKWDYPAIKNSSYRPFSSAGTYIDGSNGLVCSFVNTISTNNNRATTPDSSALDITGDIEIVVRIKFGDISSTGFGKGILSKQLGATGYGMQMLSTGALRFSWGNASTTTNIDVNSATHGLVAGTTYWLKVTLDVDNGASQRVITFYKSNDSETEPTSWTTFSTTTSSGTTSIAVNAVALTVGAMQTATVFNGNIYRVIIRNGIGGTTAFDANFAAQAVNTLTFKESSANAADVFIVSTRYFYGIPCNPINATTSTYAPGANNIVYTPFLITEPVTLESLAFEVTSATTTRNVRFGIYEADGDFQPIGNPVLDTGDIPVLANAIGSYIKPLSPTVALVPGPYLVAYNCSATTTLRYYSTFSGNSNGVPNGGAQSFVYTYTGYTYGPFPTANEAIKWYSTDASSASGVRHLCRFSWSPS